MKQIPKARSKDLLVRRLDGETLVYDTRKFKATCLNPLASRIWDLCDGERGLDDIVDICGSADVDRDAVTYALGKLSTANLLEARFTPQPGATRRSVVGQLAGTMGLAMAITSISVSAASQGASCLPKHSPCSMDVQCCSGRCLPSNKCQ